MKRNQSGFTLIEIAIVLVIIGLLLGGVLKGQELINSAKVKNLATDFRNVPIFVYGYQDKFRNLPGDDPAVTTHLGATAAALQATTPTTCNNGTTPASGNCTGNGLIDGVWDSVNQHDESFLFWGQVRQAGLTTGSTDPTSATYLPVNAIGGKLGIQSNVGFTTITQNAAGTASPMTGTYIVCSDGVLGKFVVQLDTTLDDGNTETGSVRAITSGATGKAVATTSITDGAVYTVCMAI